MRRPQPKHPIEPKDPNTIAEEVKAANPKNVPVHTPVAVAVAVNA